MDIDYCIDLLSMLRGFRDSGRLCDTRLIVDTYTIPAHKLILIGASEYFSILFSDHFLDSNKRDIHLNNLDGQSVNELVKYMYSGELDLNDDTIFSILTTADFLQIRSAIKLCENYIINNININNCIKYFIFMDRYSHLKIYNEVFKSIQKYILDVINSSDFKLLSEEMIIKLLSSDELGVYDEDFIVLILTKWLDSVKKECTVELLRCVRLPLISIHGMKSLYNHPRVCSNPKCLEFCNNVPFLEYPPRNSFIRYIVALGTDKYEQISVEHYCQHTKSWNRKHSFDNRSNFSVAVLDDIMYLIGGKKSGSATSDVIGYDIDGNYWINDIPSLNTPRYNTGVTTHKGYIYCMGGKINERTIISDVDRWKPSNRCWKRVTNTPVAKFSMGVVSLNDSIYTIGGMTKNRGMRREFIHLDTVESLSTLGWAKHSSLPEKLSSVAITVHNGKIYVAGGFTYNNISHESDSFYSYNPISDEWTKINMSVVRDGTSALCSISNKIYLIGRYRRLEIYNTEDDTWESTNELQNTNTYVEGQHVAVFKYKCPWKNEQYRDDFLSHLETFIHNR
ncbi:BTB kelch domain protein [NY_014 poxvirus]|uniref:BTB kelch domain protein n=1 Tax=NY_014 poxvirus TaxID=2025360 RepID=UPI000B9A0FA2|nr:BTB kelch domain protein [NY_014 poxvirus]AST09568.1 BTB kelch domain protein [NY_014 poxvirus]